LKYEEDLDANEREKFVDFIYKSILNLSEGDNVPDACSTSRYCEAAIGGDQLPLKALAKILDRKSGTGLVERLFQDASLVAINSISDDQIQERMGAHIVDPYSIDHESMTSSRISDEIVANGGLMQSYMNIQSSIEQTISRVKAIVGEDDIMKRALQQQEVERYGGESRPLPPQTLADGSIYTGDWVGTVRHGKGKLFFDDGTTYEGQFELGKVHGHASKMLLSGATYEGQWRNGKEDGEGKEVSLDGSVYQGQYKEGIKQGIASIYLPDGSTYQGEVVEGKMQGRGKYVWGNGHMYEGDWADDMMHGDGVYTWPDGIQFTGQYGNNLKNGRGMMCWPDGRRFIGTYDNNVKHGKGKMVMADGMMAEGEWNNGREISGRMPTSTPASTSSKKQVASTSSRQSPPAPAPATSSNTEVVEVMEVVEVPEKVVEEAQDPVEPVNGQSSGAEPEPEAEEANIDKAVASSNEEDFARADKDMSGKLSLPEFKSLATNLSKEIPSDADIEEIFQKYDKDKSGSISKDEFLPAFGALQELQKRLQEEERAAEEEEVPADAMPVAASSSILANRK